MFDYLHSYALIISRLCLQKRPLYVILSNKESDKDNDFDEKCYYHIYS